MSHASTEDSELRAWLTAIPPEPRFFGRLRLAAVRFFRRRRAGGGYGGGDSPPEGAVLPVRPKRPAPTLLAAAELELPQD